MAAPNKKVPPALDGKVAPMTIIHEYYHRAYLYEGGCLVRLTTCIYALLLFVMQRVNKKVSLKIN